MRIVPMSFLSLDGVYQGPGAPYLRGVFPRLADHHGPGRPDRGAAEHAPGARGGHETSGHLGGPATVIAHDVATRLASLKREEDGELQIHGSGRLGRSRLGMGLADELRLVTAPVVVGQGRKLFGGTEAPIGLDILSHDWTPSGLVVSRFACAGELAVGTYVRGKTNVSAKSTQSD